MWSVVDGLDDLVSSSPLDVAVVGRHTTLSTDEALLLLLLLDFPASSLAVVESLFRLPLLSSLRVTFDCLNSKTVTK